MAQTWQTMENCVICKEQLKPIMKLYNSNRGGVRLSQSPSHDFFRFWCVRFLSGVFALFNFFIVPIHRVITKNISESTCGKSKGGGGGYM